MQIPEVFSHVRALCQQLVDLCPLLVARHHVVVVQHLPAVLNVERIEELHLQLLLGLRVGLFDLGHGLDELIAVSLVNASGAHRLIRLRRLLAQRAEARLDPRLRLRRRALSEQHRSCNRARHVALPVGVDRILEPPVRRIAALPLQGADALPHFLDLPAAERQQPVGRRVDHFLPDLRQLFLVRRGLRVQRSQDVLYIRHGAGEGELAAAHQVPDKRCFLPDVLRQILNRSDRALRLRLLDKSAAGRRVHQIIQLIPRQIAHRVVDDPQRIEHRASSDEIFI